MEPIYGSMQMQAILDTVMDKRVKRKKALTSILFPDASAKTLPMGTVQWDELTGTLGMAPFVEVNGKAVTTDRLSGGTVAIETPMINLKRPVTVNTVMLARQAGENILVGVNEDPIKKHIAQTIAQDLMDMDELILNRIEWMVSQLLRGSISYSVEGKASYSVTTPKPSGNTFTVSNLWTDTTNATPLQNILAAKKVVQPYSGPAFQAAICGSGAAAALQNLMEKGVITSLNTTSGVSAGSGSLISEWEDNGMLYLGTFGGIRFFEYAGTYPDDTTGTSTAYVRSEYVEFIAPYSPLTHKTFYGAIPDIEAVMANRHIAQRYATQDIDKDGGTLINYLKSRPLPWMLRPDWNVSMKVTA